MKKKVFDAYTDWANLYPFLIFFPLYLGIYPAVSCDRPLAPGQGLVSVDGDIAIGGLMVMMDNENGMIGDEKRMRYLCNATSNIRISNFDYNREDVLSNQIWP